MRKGVVTAKTRENTLARLHEGGFVARPKNMSGLQWTSALAALEAEGYVFERRIGQGHNNGARLVSAPVNRYAGAERAAEPPIRVACRSRVFGAGGREPLPPSHPQAVPEPSKSDPQVTPEESAPDVVDAIMARISTTPPPFPNETAGPHAPAACEEQTAPAPAAPTPRPHAPVPFAGHHLDFELVAIGKCLGIIDSLGDPEARKRVAAYVAARFL